MEQASIWEVKDKRCCRPVCGSCIVIASGLAGARRELVSRVTDRAWLSLLAQSCVSGWISLTRGAVLFLQCFQTKPLTALQSTVQI